MKQAIHIGLSIALGLAAAVLVLCVVFKIADTIGPLPAGGIVFILLCIYGRPNKDEVKRQPIAEGVTRRPRMQSPNMRGNMPQGKEGSKGLPAQTNANKEEAASLQAPTKKRRKTPVIVETKAVQLDAFTSLN